MLDINKIIEQKQWVSEFLQWQTNLHNQFNLETEKETLNFNLVQLVFKGKMLFTEQMMSGLRTCHESSIDAGKQIKVFANPVYKNWLHTPLVKKHAEQLQRIHDIIY